MAASNRFAALVGGGGAEPSAPGSRSVKKKQRAADHRWVVCATCPSRSQSGVGGGGVPLPALPAAAAAASSAPTLPVAWVPGNHRRGHGSDDGGSGFTMLAQQPCHPCPGSAAGHPPLPRQRPQTLHWGDVAPPEQQQQYGQQGQLHYTLALSDDNLLVRGGAAQSRAGQERAGCPSSATS